jgi:hypothetical protein
VLLPVRISVPAPIFSSGRADPAGNSEITPAWVAASPELATLSWVSFELSTIGLAMVTPSA